MWKLTPILLMIHCVVGDHNREYRIDPLVETKLGLVRGLKSDNGQFSMFLGIPYAVVDEENPFGLAFDHPPFETPFDAYDGTVMCPQVNRQGAVVGQIQCLKLNIYVPNNASSQNHLPVMVYIHGGAFIEGSGTNIIGTPSYLIQKDIVVVSINYRVGIYGFLCTDSSKAPGNIGLKDQLKALRWINENIGYFGGDNSKITVFGESAGAMSVHMHLLSSHEKLFDQAIIQSGPATSPWTIVDTDNSVAFRIAETLGLITEDLNEAINFIATANVELVVAASNLLKSTSQYSSEPLTKACVERQFDDIESFVTENPNEALSIKAKTIPVIIGVASQELIFQHAGQMETFYNNYSFKDLLEFGFKFPDNEDISTVMRHFYIGDEAPSEKLQNVITSFASDFVFNHPTERAVNLFLESGAKAVYRYVFSYVGERSTIKLTNTTLTGASHTDDMNYLFDTSYVPNVPSTDDELMIQRMTTLWTNFAKYGDPTPETSELLPVKWEPVSQDSEPYLKIDKELTLEHRPFHDRMAFWDLFYKVNEDKTKWFNEPSVPHADFEDTFNAYDGSVVCPQGGMQGEVRGQIQCLLLNIYVPNAATYQNQLPVMVYIHGGAFSGGSGTNVIETAYRNLIQNDVIVVSINYRLGIYGFMCTDSSKAPGNTGLKDQLLALRWINEHIGSFGGDKSKITIFGESAGAMSVHLQLLSHHEKLFDRVIIQSGPATSPWSFVDIDNSIPLRIAEILGLVTEDINEAIDFIASANVELAIAAGSQLKIASQYTNEPLTKACVEKEFEGIERFVTENPNVAKPVKAKTIPVMIGYASQELISQHMRQQEEFYNNYSFKDLLEFGFDVTDFDDMIDVIKHFYIGDEAPGERLQNEITSFASDFAFNHPTERAVKLLLESEAKAIYHYKFSYVGEKSTVKSSNTTFTEASHADEINYLFESNFVSNEINVEDQLMIDRLTTMWTNFAKYGDPTPETSELLPVKWEPVSQDLEPYLNIDKALSLEYRPFHDRMAFWDLFYKLNEGKTNWNKLV